LRLHADWAAQVSPLTLQLVQHLKHHKDNSTGMFDALLRRISSIPDLLEALVVSNGGAALFSYLLNAHISDLTTDTEKFEALKHAPGVKVCNVYFSYSE
jgi:hypothetical protein